jgi:hypothetical protein
MVRARTGAVREKNANFMAGFYHRFQGRRIDGVSKRMENCPFHVSDEFSRL